MKYYAVFEVFIGWCFLLNGVLVVFYVRDLFIMYGEVKVSFTALVY
jgi:hypothetical protein